MRHIRPLLCGVALFLGAGCSFKYLPRAPMTGRSGAAELRVLGIEAPGGTVLYQTELEAPADTQLLGAQLLVSGGETCPEQGQLQSLERDDSKAEPPFAIGGQHQLNLGFAPMPWGCDAQALELELGGAQRVQVPLRIPAGWEISNRLVLSAGMESTFAATGDVGGAMGLVAASLGIGTWVGPVRLTLHPGLIGMVVCEEATCPLDPGGHRRVAPVLPLGFGATWYPWVADARALNPRGQLAVGFELRLRENLAWLPLEGGTQLRVLHAPQAVVHLVASSGTAPHGLPAGPRISSFDLELSAGALISGGRASVALGAGLGAYWGL